ncbi:50S ribosomal protein L17 [Candidatus Peribacteria bacterium]|nr:50S ribosomal protein L17 [Candidatus Peribacteria bacterium]
MRHKHSRLRLRHKPAYSRAMQRNLVTSVLLYESIRTTKKRAEVVQPIVEKIITAAKTKDARNAIRSINAFVMDKNACRKVMELLKDRYSKRTSGFTRMTALGLRKGDGAKMVTLELIDSEVPAKATKANASTTTVKA